MSVALGWKVAPAHSWRDGASSRAGHRLGQLWDPDIGSLLLVSHLDPVFVKKWRPESL